jgi:DNA-binding NarL/FixJ family response regulator
MSILQKNRIDKRILIVEDQIDMQALYRAVFGGTPGFQVVAIIDSAEEALEQAEALRPDLVIIDISLPRMSGLDLTRRLSQLLPALKILISTGHARERYYESALRMGAHEVIAKGDIHELRQAVERLLKD